MQKEKNCHFSTEKLIFAKNGRYICKMILILSENRQNAIIAQKSLLKTGVFCDIKNPHEVFSPSDYSACIFIDDLYKKDKDLINFIKDVSPEELNACSFRQLCVGCRKNDVFYLGYPLCLTDTEFSILRILAKACGNTLSAETISNYCVLSGSAQNVSVHISHINGKAKDISDRILVKNDKKLGYFLNNEM